MHASLENLEICNNTADTTNRERKMSEGGDYQQYDDHELKSPGLELACCYYLHSVHLQKILEESGNQAKLWTLSREQSVSIIEASL